MDPDSLSMMMSSPANGDPSDRERIGVVDEQEVDSPAQREGAGSNLKHSSLCPFCFAAPAWVDNGAPLSPRKSECTCSLLLKRTAIAILKETCGRRKLD
ncbi:hypothetical protein GJAV_G00055430 [Gymnothorax javanicus]|nr:hypothetical protein GJAV_G00055430 [Gymnothorax javanicus]